MEYYESGLSQLVILLHLDHILSDNRRRILVSVRVRSRRPLFLTCILEESQEDPKDHVGGALLRMKQEMKNSDDEET